MPVLGAPGVKIALEIAHMAFSAGGFVIGWAGFIGPPIAERVLAAPKVLRRFFVGEHAVRRGCIGDGSLWLFIGESSPKRFDLRNDGRFALHCAVEDRNGGAGEIHVAGTATEITDAKREVAARAWPTGQPRAEWLLFELLPATVRWTEYVEGLPRRESWTATGSFKING